MTNDPLASRLISGITMPSQLEQDAATSMLHGFLLRARNGDAVAFTHLFDLYHSRIFTHIVHIVGRHEDAEDLVQETFLKAWKSLHLLDNDSRFVPWLYKIATRTTFDHLRSQKLRWGIWIQQDEKAFEQEGSHTIEFEAQIAEAEQIRAALGQVAQRYRVCLLLYFDGGCTQREIGELLQMSEKNVNVYIRRGCDQFRSAYSALEKGLYNKSSRKRRNGALHND